MTSHGWAWPGIGAGWTDEVAGEGYWELAAAHKAAAAEWTDADCLEQAWPALKGDDAK